MIWRLTLVGAMISLVPLISWGQTPASSSSKSTRAAAQSIQWEQLPLSDAIGRLKAVSGAEVFLDRRVDPTQKINLMLENAGVDEIVAQLAANCSLGDVRLEQLCYIGPPQTTERLIALAALRRHDVAALPADVKRSLADQRRIFWPRLTEPRGLVKQLIEDHGWSARGDERIPHDLWAAGALPAMALSDQLTVLLAGFDLTYRVVADKRAIEIVPVEWNAIEPANPAHKKSAAAPRAGKQVFTLRVENQPVGKVLDQLGRRLGWKLAVDEPAIRAAGRSLDERVTFTVENADEDQLLEALLAPARLRAQRDGKSVQVMPR